MNSLKAITLSLLGLGLLWTAVHTLYWLSPKPTEAVIDEAESIETFEIIEEVEVLIDEQPVPESYSRWVPDLTQSIEQLEEWIATDLPQQELNFTMANLNMVYDAKLYIKFQELLKLADHSDHPDLILQQARWLEVRQTLAMKAFNDYGGGSLASYHAGEISLQLTRQRLDELNRNKSRLAKP
jgi:uncharacterized protein YecT (DUF1311 family)